MKPLPKFLTIIQIREIEKVTFSIILAQEQELFTATQFFLRLQ